MPRLDIDRDQVRMLTLSVGYEEASKRTGIKACTIRQWSKRDGDWFADIKKPKQLPPSMRPQPIQPITDQNGVVTSVTKPADALADVLREDSEATRTALSRAARKGAAHLADSEPEAVIEQHQALGTLAKVAASLHGWEGQSSGVTVNIGIVGG